MMNLRKEYNEFGPWLTEICSEEDITHQFAHLTKEILGADLSIKVPVDKEWRNVKEGELLYDAVMSLDKVGLSYHRIIEGVAYSCKVDYSDIEFIRVIKDLLSYTIEVGTALENIHIKYTPIQPKLANQFLEMLVDGFEGSNDKAIINNIIKHKVSLYYKDGAVIGDDTMIKESLSRVR